MSRFPKLSTFAKSAAVALVLGGATLGAAMPAQAAPPQIDFHFGFGGGGGSVGGGPYRPRDRQGPPPPQWPGHQDNRLTHPRGRPPSARGQQDHPAYLRRGESGRAPAVPLRPRRLPFPRPGR